MVTHARIMHVVHSCGHSSHIKVAPTISAEFGRLIRNEAANELCSLCTKMANKRAGKKRSG
jgi:hypothetical protein